MKKIFIKILGIFSLMFIFMFNVNTKISLSLSLGKIIFIIKKNKKTVIPIAMATDNNYAYTTW